MPACNNLTTCSLLKADLANHRMWSRVNEYSTVADLPPPMWLNTFVRHLDFFYWFIAWNVYR